MLFMRTIKILYSVFSVCVCVCCVCIHVRVSIFIIISYFGILFLEYCI